MGLSWQQGPLSPGAVGHFFVPEPLPKSLEPGQRVVPHGPDRRLTVAGARPRNQP